MNREELLAYALAYQGEYHKIHKAIRYKEKVPVCHYDSDYITILDKEYPVALLDLKYPPFVLFYKGDISLLQKKSVSIVGSRNASEYGRDVTSEIATRLKECAVLVSGMAKGIDAIVHKCALEDGNTIGVLGCGIDSVYPLENQSLYERMSQKQLLISEYPNKVPPYRYHFPVRNRIIAALSSCLIVTEANMQSGTFLTVNEALELNRDIYSVVSMFRKEISGCNYLIQQGANMISCIEDIENIASVFDK